jgi:Tfp pilus assembly PilM family ATPase
MKHLGIYLGPKVITLVETKDKRVTNVAELPQTILSTGDLEEKVPAEIKLAESISFFRNELTKNNIEAKEATLCLPGQDMFVRSFEMPAMSQDELQNAIKFEAEKYIPFKTENLISDFQARFERASKTNLILFVGLKKETLDRYLSVLTQLNIKVTGIEYAGFSILRSLQQVHTNTRGVFGVLILDMKGEDEVNFLVLENGFPLFSRDFILAPEEGASAIAQTGGIAEKLKTEIQVSLDYYERKYPTKPVKKLILISKPECRPDCEFIARDLGFTLQSVDLSRQIGGAFTYSTNAVKAFAAASSPAVKHPLKINLLAAQERVRELSMGKDKDRLYGMGSGAPFFEGVTVDSRMVGLGIALCAGVFLYGFYQTQPLKDELDNIRRARPAVSTVSAESTYEELSAIDSQYTQKLNTLNELVKKQLYLIEPLNAIPKLLPKGMWLTRCTYSKDENRGAELILDGTVYLGDNAREFETVYQMVSSLKSSTEISKNFKNISVSSVNRSQLYSMAVTEFSISCKSGQTK